MAKFGKALLVACGCVVILLAAVYSFRTSVLRAGLNAVLGGDVTVTRVQGVRLGSGHAEIAEIELSLGAGRQLIVSGIALDFIMQGLFAVPAVQNVTVVSARLTDSSPALDPSLPQSEDRAADEGDVPLLLSELLQQLQNFPLARLDLNEMQLPQFRQKLALHMEQQADGLQLQLASGALQLVAGVSQASPDAAAHFELSLQAGAAVLAETKLSLVPGSSGYQLTGDGKVAIPDANTAFAEYLARPLPISEITVEWDVAATVSDALLSDPASLISLGVASGSALTLNAGIVPELGELAVIFSQRSELSLALGADMSITGRLPLRLTGSWQQQALQTELTLTPAECRTGAILECRVGFDGTASLAAFTTAGTSPAEITTFNALEFTGGGNVQIDGELIQVTLAPGTQLDSGMVVAPAFQIAALNVVNEAALAVTSGLADSQLTIAGDSVLLTLNEFASGEYSVNGDIALRTINLQSAARLMGSLQIQTAGLAVSGPQWVPTVGIDARLDIDGDLLTFDAPLQLHNATADAQLQAAGSYDLASGVGQFKLQLPALALTGEGNSLSSYLSGWPYAADIMTGTLALDLDVQLQPAASNVGEDATIITARTKIMLSDVAGFYAENFFRGLNATIDADYDSAAPALPLTTPRSTLTLDELNVGLPITDIAIDYQLDAASQTVSVNSVFARALDGTVSGMDIHYDFSKDINEFDLSFAGLRLERMMELVEYEGIEASGAVSGELPVTVTGGNKIEIDAGRLYAEAPGGSIRYLDAPPAGQGNPAMDFVNQALSNYQFQSLESAIDYTPDGELLLAMQMRGSNPDMNGGQAINLNLTISDNIPTLLKSLQAGRAIEDFLQEQYE